jgi:hypothetical protein
METSFLSRIQGAVVGQGIVKLINGLVYTEMVIIGQSQGVRAEDAIKID